MPSGDLPFLSYAVGLWTCFSVPARNSEECVDTPSPEGRSRVLGKMVFKSYCINSVTLGETQGT